MTTLTDHVVLVGHGRGEQEIARAMVSSIPTEPLPAEPVPEEPRPEEPGIGAPGASPAVS